ncbi:hypothetical protein YSA_02173 [Pseudomonas putida ND6]|uniref:Uncharacterized protein n=1 Tax=Pseudomonas putida ND6 TaxID=231023 RepID=I3UR24_PSEPU|nr:hypothetical protein YSA_02173 [Pseudomonas putida ND6]
MIRYRKTTWQIATNRAKFPSDMKFFLEFFVDNISL